LRPGTNSLWLGIERLGTCGRGSHHKVIGEVEEDHAEAVSAMQQRGAEINEFKAMSRDERTEKSAERDLLSK
jgi:hypothetical protein